MLNYFRSFFWKIINTKKTFLKLTLKFKKSINLLGDDWNKPGEPGPAPIILVICEWAVEYEATAAAAAEFAAFGPGEVTLIW